MVFQKKKKNNNSNNNSNNNNNNNAKDFAKSTDLDGGARSAALGAGAALVGRLGLGRVVAAALALAVAVHRT